MDSAAPGPRYPRLIRQQREPDRHGPLARFHGGPLATREVRIGGIGPPRLVVAMRSDGTFELGVESDEFEPEFETHVYVRGTRGALPVVDYTAEGWATAYVVGQRVVTLVDDRWIAGTIERIYSAEHGFAGTRRRERELYGVRWDVWPRIGGPDRESVYREGHRADELEREEDL